MLTCSWKYCRTSDLLCFVSLCRWIFSISFTLSTRISSELLLAWYNWYLCDLSLGQSSVCSSYSLPCGISTAFIQATRERKQDQGEVKTEQQYRAEQGSGRWEETQEAFTRQEFWISICRYTNTHNKREWEQRKENCSLTLPTLDDAKMIIMPESLQWCQNPLPFPILGNWPIQ